MRRWSDCDSRVPGAISGQSAPLLRFPEFVGAVPGQSAPLLRFPVFEGVISLSESGVFFQCAQLPKRVEAAASIGFVAPRWFRLACFWHISTGKVRASGNEYSQFPVARVSSESLVCFVGAHSAKSSILCLSRCLRGAFISKRIIAVFGQDILKNISLSVLNLCNEPLRRSRRSQPLVLMLVFDPRLDLVSGCVEQLLI